MSTNTRKPKASRTGRRIQQNSSETVCQAFDHAGIEPRGLTPDSFYPAKKKFEGFCPDCNTNLTDVTVRMLRAGNRNCLCRDHSFHGLDPQTSPPDEIAERIDKLGIAREAELKAFSSTFFNAMGRERFNAVIACSQKMNVVRKHQTRQSSKEELLEHLGKMANRSQLYKKAYQVYRNYLSKGGTDEELVATYAHLAPKNPEITDAERDVKHLWKTFAARVKNNPGYSLNDLHADYRGARFIYETVSKRGVPIPLVFQNATRFHLKTHPPINLPRKWVLQCPDQYIARLKVCARTARKSLALEAPDVEFTAKHLDSKDGKIHLEPLVNDVIEKFAVHDQTLIKTILAKSPGLDWHALSAAAQSERIREELLAQIGFPKTMLSHKNRETQYREVVERTLQLEISTNKAFREQCRPFYKFLRKEGLQDLFLIEMGWAGAYVAVHAEIVCNSEFEAVVANILSLAKTPFVHNKTYPRQGGTSYRYDFFLPASSVYVEVYMFRRDSAKAAPGGHRRAPAYINARTRKESLHAAMQLSVVAIENEDFYGETDRSLFAAYACNLLLESGALEVPLSQEDLKKCLDVHQSQVDPTEGEQALIRKLVALGLSDTVAATVVARISTGIVEKSIQLTSPDTFSSIADFDAPKVFSGIFRSNNAFMLARMVHGVVRQERFPDFQHGHWTLALGAAIDKRESDIFFKSQGRSLGKAPKTGVWYLRMRDRRVSVDKIATGLGVTKTISGNKLADKIRNALEMIVTNRSELLLTEPFIDSAVATEVSRQFRISNPTRKDIDMLIPLIMRRMKFGEDTSGQA